jgi:hypothetical protein
MTSGGSVPPHLVSLENSRFLAVLKRRDYLGLRWFAAPRAFTSGAPHPRFCERGQSTTHLWRNANHRPSRIKRCFTSQLS